MKKVVFLLGLLGFFSCCTDEEAEFFKKQKRNVEIQGAWKEVTSDSSTNYPNYYHFEDLKVKKYSLIQANKYAYTKIYWYNNDAYLCFYGGSTWAKRDKSYSKLYLLNATKDTLSLIVNQETKEVKKYAKISVNDLPNAN